LGHESFGTVIQCWDKVRYIKPDDRFLRPEMKLKDLTDEASTHQYLLDLVRTQTIPLKNFYSHVIPFDHFEEGFKLLIEKRASKIVFTMQ